MCQWYSFPVDADVGDIAAMYLYNLYKLPVGGISRQVCRPMSVSGPEHICHEIMRKYH